VAIYDERPGGVGLFKSPRYVIKGGEIVVEEGQIRAVAEGREFVVQPPFDPGIEDYLRPIFQQLYTISFDNYPVEAERVHGMQLAGCLPRG
jgi:formylmethanofuran dehydrogenase subunit A